MVQAAGVTVIGLGPGHPDLLTVGALRTLEQAVPLVLRTDRHGVAASLRQRGIAFETLDALYEDSQDFDELSDRITAALLCRLAAGGALYYAVADPAQDATVAALLAALPSGTSVAILPGVSMAARTQAAAQGMGPHRVVAAMGAKDLPCEPECALCLTELDSAMVAGEAKLWLLERYPPELRVLFVTPGEEACGNVRAIALEDLDRQPVYDHTASLWVPAVDYQQRARFGFADLVRIMEVLRAPNGCPWDREQTHESLRPYLIEEAYEAVDAIDSGDPMALADELGDVLLQVVFHAQVGLQHGTFDIGDVTTAICHKMITRHAHIFGDARCDTAEDVLRNWDKIKQQERGQSTQAEALAGVPKYLPALMRAAKVQKKAANVGFDWSCAKDALEKVLEETQELRAELDAQADPQEEGGDLLFAVVNTLRLAGVQPELALSAATEKFIHRFTRMEAAIQADGLRMEKMTLADMDVYWAKIKQEH